MDVQHTFFVISLPFFCTTTTKKFLVTHFMEEMSYIVCVPVFFFSLPLIFILVAASISHILTAAFKFSCLSSK